MSAGHGGGRRVLILGAAGMLGNTVLRFLASSRGYEVIGTLRSSADVALLPERLQPNLMAPVDVGDVDGLTRLFATVAPDVVINCVGVVKQRHDAEDPLTAIPINSVLPHRLARLCEAAEARLVHISTDCVFSGEKGNYTEADAPDARDLYGRSKLLGEVDYPHAVTLRTSIVGHELRGAQGLVCWFLSQRGSVKGYRRAIFSGVPAVELARIIRDFVIPNPALRGLYHVAVRAINKRDLLALIASVYGAATEIVPDDAVAIDRSLDATRFISATGYHPPTWPELIDQMHAFR